MATFAVEVIETAIHTHTVEAQSLSEACEEAIFLAKNTTPDDVKYVIGDVKVLSGGSLA